MPPHRRFRAPSGNGDVLADPGFDRVPGLVERNRRLLDRSDVKVGGLPLPEFRALARREVLELARAYTESQSPGATLPGLSPDAPLLVAGHQPELSHPGVWVKNFALNGFARKIGGTALNLVVDNDTLKSTSERIPVLAGRDPAGVHLETVPFDRFGAEEPYEDRGVHDPECFRTFADRAAPLWQTWTYEPVLPRAWGDVVHNPAPTVGGKFAAVRRAWERAWGCTNLELPVSRLAPETRSFARFVSSILSDLERFLSVYNNAVRDYRERHGIRSRSHPVPDLAADGEWYEAPFWLWNRGERREPLRVRLNEAASTPYAMIRPRALTLTLFARLCLGDFFIHGIGGGKYDEVTDAVIRDYFGIEPPAYQVLSATLHLPLPGFPATADEVKRLERLERDLYWNPHRHLPDPGPPGREHAALAAAEPPAGPARKARYRAFRRIGDQLRPRVTGRLADVRRQLTRARQEAHANAILRRRDYSWVLFPGDVLRPFLQRFLDV